MDIIKSTGEQEAFSKDKFCVSLKQAGTPEALADKICNRIGNKITPGVSTTKIFREALRYLVKDNIQVAARYSLRRGIAALGPAGFIFEQYVEVILQAYGFETKRDQIMYGACAPHEIDLIAMKDNIHYLLELKYHNESGIKTHIEVVMYADARLMDIAKVENKKEKGQFQHRMWLITNTKFTDTAIMYAKCKNIKLSGWDYPYHDSLENMIVDKNLYPVTVLPSVTPQFLATLAEKKIVLAQDLLTYSVLDLIALGLPEDKALKVFNEVKGLMKV